MRYAKNKLRIEEKFNKSKKIIRTDIYNNYIILEKKNHLKSSNIEIIKKIQFLIVLVKDE